jgi:L-alanine-DL-glutamate epimerase-like enolase superfamily enzyme
MIGCMLESSISVAAAVHLAVAKSDVITKIDLDGPSLCRSIRSMAACSSTNRRSA